MAKTTEVKRQYSAAKHLSKADQRRQRLEDRTQRATSTLAAALQDRDRVTVPGYAVTRAPSGIRVEPTDPPDVDQLRLWAESQETP